MKFRNYEVSLNNPLRNFLSLILSVNVTNVVEQSSRRNFLLVVKILKNISAGGNNVGVLEIPL